MNVYKNKPDPFFEIITHDITKVPGITGAHVGYESGTWRYSEMAEYLIEWLPEFALKYSDLEDINSGTTRKTLRKAAQVVYNTDKYKKRGEFGELLLHALIREVFNSEPAISKLYYKTAVNDTVKGFDAVHIVEQNNELELWLGEVKFYMDLKSAFNSVIEEIHNHLDGDYLRNEFILVSSKIDDKWKYAQDLKKLISSRTSLDTLFKRICVPVLVTYESDVVKAGSSDTAKFKADLKNELNKNYSTFLEYKLPDIKIHLFLTPLGLKSELISTLHSKLEGMQR